MSAVVDYSKWDNLEDSDEEASGAPPAGAAGAPDGAQSTPAATSAGGDAATVATTREAAGPDGHVLDHKGSMRSVGSLTPKGTEKGRYQFKHEGRVIYEWEQSLEDVTVYVTPPPGVVPDMIDCRLTPQHLTLGIRGNPPFLDEPTGGPIIQKESYFYMSDGELDYAELKAISEAVSGASSTFGGNSANFLAICDSLDAKKDLAHGTISFDDFLMVTHRCPLVCHPAHHLQGLFRAKTLSPSEWDGVAAKFAKSNDANQGEFHTQMREAGLKILEENHVDHSSVLG